MIEKPCVSLAEVFGELKDPRVEGHCDHKLVEVTIIAACAGLTGVESWVEIETIGVMKEAWLRTFLELPNGIPSHDTFGRVFAVLDAEAFQACFIRWVEGIFQVMKGKSLASTAALSLLNTSVIMMAGRIYRPWFGFSANVTSMANLSAKSPNTSVHCLMMLNVFFPLPVLIGPLKTAFTGSCMSIFMKMIPTFAFVTVLRIWLSCAISP
jgi:hypothetical protein